MDDSEAELRNGIIRYFMCAEVLFRDENSIEIQNSLRNIINKQDKRGRTPLYLAAKDWPQNIIKELLRFGADLSIPSNEDKYPLRRIPEKTIIDILDSHCMKSNALLKLAKRRDVLVQNGEFNGNGNDNLTKEEQEAYKKLMEDYEPRFMTHIGHSPVKFDYEILAPTRYSNPDPMNSNSETEKRRSTEIRDIRPPKQPEMEVLSQLCESKAHHNIIKHPVVKSWVWLKWNRVRKYYHKELRMDLLLMWFMTWYIIQTFGGYEWNNKCKMFHAREDAKQNDVNQFKVLNSTKLAPMENPDWDWSNYTHEKFCKYYEVTLQVTEQFIPYGHLEKLDVIARIQHHWDNIFHSSMSDHTLACTYSKPAYVVFVFMAVGLIYWMVVDAVEMFNSSNPYKRRHTKHTNVFFTKVVPMLGFIRDFTIIMAVLILADAMLWIAITALFVSMLVGEINQFIVKPKNYLLSPKNWSDILQLILIAIILYVPNEAISDPMYFSLSCHIAALCPDETPVNDGCCTEKRDPNIFDEADVSVKRGMSAFLIVLSWSRLLLQIANHPSKKTEQLNKYAMMYQTVAKSFMRLLFIYGIFIVSFAMGFYIVFHNDIGDDHQLDVESLTSYQFFNTPYETFAKTMAMFVGEVDFNNMPIGISYARRDGNVSVTLGYLFFLTFIFMVVMVLMNLLNGLAVSDIAEIVAKAEVKHQISMVNILKEYEDRAINNKMALDYFSSCLPCLKPILEIFDFEQELKVFPERMKPINLPYTPHNKRNESKLNRLNWLYMTRRDKKMKVGYEHILSEARKIIFDSNKSEMSKSNI